MVVAINPPESLLEYPEMEEEPQLELELPLSDLAAAEEKEIEQKPEKVAPAKDQLSLF